MIFLNSVYSGKFAAYNKTDDGWIIFNDNQYYISEYAHVSMEEARWFCKQRNGDLVVINDEKERVFLWHQVILLIESCNISWPYTYL